MIFDRLENLENYKSVHSRFSDAIAFLQSVLRENGEDGKREMPNADVAGAVSVNVFHLEPKPWECSKPEAHKRYTGVSNERILENAAALKASGIPHVFRIPLIPAVTDTHENLAAIAAFVGDSRAELLSYNALAPAKYAGVGMAYPDWIDKKNASTPDLSLFKNAVIQK